MYGPSYSSYYIRLRCAGVVAAPESLWLPFFCFPCHTPGNTIFSAPTCSVIVNICLMCQSLALKHIEVSLHFFVFLYFSMKSIYGSQCFCLRELRIHRYVYIHSRASILFECNIRNDNFMCILMSCEYLINVQNSMLAI